MHELYTEWWLAFQKKKILFPALVYLLVHNVIVGLYITLVFFFPQTSHQLLGPKPFPLDRLMAIFYSIVDARVAPTANVFSQVCQSCAKSKLTDFVANNGHLKIFLIIITVPLLEGHPSFWSRKKEWFYHVSHFLQKLVYSNIWNLGVSLFFKHFPSFVPLSEFDSWQVCRLNFSCVRQAILYDLVDIIMCVYVDVEVKIIIFNTFC